MITHSMNCFAIMKLVSSKGINLYIVHRWYHPFQISCSKSTPESNGQAFRSEEPQNIRENTRSRTLHQCAQSRIGDKQSFPDNADKQSESVVRGRSHLCTGSRRASGRQMSNNRRPPYQASAQSGIHLRRASGTTAFSGWSPQCRSPCGGEPNRGRARPRRASRWRTGTRRPRRP